MSLKFPSAQTILVLIGGIVCLLTWIIPSGQYDRLSYNKDNGTFIQTGQISAEFPGNQATLDSIGLSIPFENFESGAIWKPVAVPGTYHTLEANPQDVVAFLQAPVKGITQAIDVILFVLIIGGFIGIVHHTGAFDQGIASLAGNLKGREMWLIIVIMILIAIGGTTFGLAEETIAFFPILIPVFIAAGYDALVAIAAIFLASSIGTLASTVNPFSAIIASDTAGVNWTEGIIGRFVMLVLGLTLCIWYVIRYGEKVKINPETSIIYGQKAEIEAMFSRSTVHADQKLSGKLKMVLILFGLTFIIMIYGVSQLEWWFMEMTTLFLGMAVFIGILVRIKEASFIEIFVRGAGDLLGVAFIIGIARGITVIMEDGLISDTVLFYASQLIEGMPGSVFAVVMFYIYAGLSFFIPSSSGMAVLTMPIFAPLADVVGQSRTIVIDAYMYGQGLFYFINPTGLILASLGVAKIGFDKWLKFVWPLVLMMMVLILVVLVVGVYI